MNFSAFNAFEPFEVLGYKPSVFKLTDSNC